LRPADCRRVVSIDWSRRLIAASWPSDWSGWADCRVLVRAIGRCRLTVGDLFRAIGRGLLTVGELVRALVEAADCRELVRAIGRGRLTSASWSDDWSRRLTVGDWSERWSGRLIWRRETGGARTNTRIHLLAIGMRQIGVVERLPGLKGRVGGPRRMSSGLGRCPTTECGAPAGAGRGWDATAPHVIRLPHDVTSIRRRRHASTGK